MKLSERLQTAANFLDNSMSVADIGADHGELPIYLAENGFKNIVCVENKKGPYQKMVNNIKKADLEDDIKCIFSDGIKDIPDYTNVVTILGMGGLTIDYILRTSLERAQKLDLLVLEPQSEEEKTREFLGQNGFEIVDEVYVKEKRKYYPVIVAKYTGNTIDYSDIELKYGPIALLKRDSLLLEKLTKEFETYKTLPLIIQKKPELVEKITKIEQILQNWYYLND